jgi:tetratricopeptide (TPR) repeat protein
MKKLLTGLLIACASWGCAHSGAATAGDSSLDPLDRADSAKATGKTDEAIADCRTALAAEPKRLDAWRLLVQLYAESGRLPEITRELQSRVAAEPNDDSLHYALGLAYFAETRTAGDVALREFQTAQKLAPTQAEYPFRLGVGYFELERYSDALEPLRRAVALAPTVAKYHVPLGLTLARLDKKKEALGEFRALLTLKPSGKEIKLAQQALERFEDPLRDIPAAESDNIKRGIQWLHQADQPQQAIETFLDVLDRYPDLAPVHTLLGLAYERLDQSGPAVEHFQRALELQPDDAQPYLYLGELYYSKQKSERAEDYFHKAVERNPLLDHAWGRLGDIALQRGDSASAITDFQAVVVLTPDVADSHKALAQAYEMAGQYDRAEDDLRNLVERSPKDLDARLRLGFLYAALSHRATAAPERESRNKQAQAEFQKVLDQRPENVAASRALQELRQAMQ